MINELHIWNGKEEIMVQVIRSGRKSIGLEVRPDGTVLVRIPNRLSDRELKKFVENHRDWILEKSRLVKTRKDTRKPIEATTPENLTPEEIERIKKKIGSRVKHYCMVMGVRVGRITIRNQKTRWGSCSSKGNVNFNYQLYYLPDELLDYVVVHELAHRRHMDHSPEFWAEVARYCPDYQECRKRLKEYRI